MAAGGGGGLRGEEGLGLLFGVEDGPIKLTAVDFREGGAVEAKLANCEAFIWGGKRWAEGAAEDGARGVKIAGLGGGIERGAGLVVGEGVEGFKRCRGGGEGPSGGIAGKGGGEAGDGGCGAGADGGGTGGIRVIEGTQALLKAMGVEGGDGEDAVAALRTAGAAGEPGAGAADGIGEGVVDDLHELGGRGHGLLVSEGARSNRRSLHSALLRSRCWRSGSIAWP